MTISGIAPSLLSCKVKKTSISRKIDLWPAITRTNVDLGSKIYHQSRDLVECSPLVFSAKLYDAPFSNGRGVASTPLLQGRVMENALQGRGREGTVSFAAIRRVLPESFAKNHGGVHPTSLQVRGLIESRQNVSNLKIGLSSLAVILWTVLLKWYRMLHKGQPICAYHNLLSSVEIVW